MIPVTTTATVNLVPLMMSIKAMILTNNRMIMSVLLSCTTNAQERSNESEHLSSIQSRVFFVCGMLTVLRMVFVWGHTCHATDLCYLCRKTCSTRWPRASRRSARKGSRRFSTSHVTLARKDDTTDKWTILGLDSSYCGSDDSSETAWDVPGRPTHC